MAEQIEKTIKLCEKYRNGFLTIKCRSKYYENHLRNIKNIFSICLEIEKGTHKNYIQAETLLNSLFELYNGELNTINRYLKENSLRTPTPVEFHCSTKNIHNGPKYYVIN